MRLVELRLDAGRPIHVELHPRLTVVLAPAEVRDRLGQVLSRAWTLAGTELDGTVETGPPELGGYLTPLDPTAVIALALDGDGPPTLGPDSLPAPDPTRHEATLRSAAADRDAWQVEVGASTGEHDDASRRVEANRAAAAAGAAELEDSRARHADLLHQREAVAVRPAALDAERAAAAEAATASRARIEELSVLRARLSELMGPGGDAGQLRLGDDTSAFLEVVDRCGAVGAIGPTTLSSSSEWLAAVASGTAPVRAEAAALIAAQGDLERQWREASAAGVEGAPEVLAARTARDTSVADRDALESLSRSGMLGDTARSEIEAAHAAATTARGRHDEAEAVAAEDRTLSRFGFDSYLDFTIATSTRSVGQKAEGKLQRVVAELAGAEEDLSVARQHAADRLERLAEAREPVQRRIAEYLGAWPDGPAEPILSRMPEVPDAIRSLPTEVDDAVASAREELVRYDDLVTDLDDEAEGLRVRAAEIEGQVAQVDARIGEIEHLIGLAEAELATAAARLDAATARRRDAEAGLATALRACDELADGAAPTHTPADLPNAVEVVAGIAAAGRTTGPPVVLVDTFAPFGADQVPDALGQLGRRLRFSQLVYLTDDPTVAAWARTLAPDAGSSVQVGRRGWLMRRRDRRLRRPATPS